MCYIPYLVKSWGNFWTKLEEPTIWELLTFLWTRKQKMQKKKKPQRIIRFFKKWKQKSEKLFQP
jgi:hypothetical protein